MCDARRALSSTTATVLCCYWCGSDMSAMDNEPNLSEVLHSQGLLLQHLIGAHYCSHSCILNTAINYVPACKQALLERYIRADPLHRTLDSISLIPRHSRSGQRAGSGDIGEMSDARSEQFVHQQKRSATLRGGQ